MDELGDLDPDTCRALLGTRGAGRVVYTEHALPAVVPSRYVVWGDRLWFPVPWWTALAGHTDGAVLAFHADRVEAAARAGWSVTALGPCRTVPAVAAPRAARDLAAGERSVMALDLVRLRGRGLSTARLDAPPARTGGRAGVLP
ncbi:pyridoxamine 5'-phosphate oxidase family protein [Kineococcus sp. SYSU DK002]|uniref:pyridoxamine 5'-phosphate oxidase family protein n=1 Tax=Kineococcus sp. SYSU DK002 TaxID=3383123 RepID=UPI003D7DE106